MKNSIDNLLDDTAVLAEKTYEMFANLVSIALETGNIAKARERIDQARELLSPARVARMVLDACREYGVRL